MSPRIILQPHLNIEELATRYRQAKDPVERSQYQIIWLLAEGKPTEEVAAVTGYSRDWVYKLARRYNQLGPDGLGDRRHNNPGAEPLLTEIQQNLLWEALKGPAPDGGAWNGRKVADWMSKLLARPVLPQRGWEYLRHMQLRLNTISSSAETELTTAEAPKRNRANSRTTTPQSHDPSRS